VTDDQGITLEDIIANYETIGANVRRLVAQRADEHGMTIVDYLTKVFFPDLARQGASIEELEWVVAMFDPNRESDSLT
jgi:hypothetical protein